DRRNRASIQSKALKYQQFEQNRVTAANAKKESLLKQWYQSRQEENTSSETPVPRQATEPTKQPAGASLSAGWDKSPVRRKEHLEFAALAVCSRTRKSEIVVDLVDRGLDRARAEKLVEELVTLRQIHVDAGCSASPEELLLAWSGR